jgi:hypothetical protein
LFETAEIETGIVEKSIWDQANIRQKLGLVWRNRKKISQIDKDYFYLPFFLSILFYGTHTTDTEGTYSAVKLVHRMLTMQGD